MNITINNCNRFYKSKREALEMARSGRYGENPTIQFYDACGLYKEVNKDNVVLWERR